MRLGCAGLDMKSIFLGFGLSLFSCALSVAQNSADYLPFRFVEQAPRVLILDGEIDFRSPLAFRRVVAAKPEATVLVMNSPGGSVQAALLIAEEVFDRKMTTVVLSESQCLSACAFIYFAGARRVVEGKLGVHQISGDGDLKDAQLHLSDILETLSKYGVSQEVITRMLRTPPEDMYVFSPAEVVSLGINRGDAAASNTPAQQQHPDRSATPNESMAKAFVLGFILSGSLPKDDLVAMSGKVYSNTVDFYGKVLTKNQVLDDKKKYAERWPIRVSTARPDSIRSSCSGDICRVTGVYDWSVSDPQRNKSAKGSATFDFEVRVAEGYKIVSENGRVLDRTAR